MPALAQAHPLHPPIEPYSIEQLEVGEGHCLYVEQCGSAHGVPMVYVHGGPGSGCSPRQRQFFDPALCRVVLFDQRGCGRSLPSGGLQHNDTDALVADLEQLRLHLGISRWLIVGGSWGAGLALAYATAHPQACLGLVLRGVFLGRASDVDWFFQDAAQRLPEAWQQLLGTPAGQAQGAVLQWLHAGLHGTDGAAALACALAWEAWEQSLTQRCTVAPRQLDPKDAQVPRLLNKYRIQSHYLVHQCFRPGVGFMPPGGRLAGLPISIVHGKSDWICRPEAALDLHRRLPGSRLHWTNCGHNPFEPANAAAMVAAIAHFANPTHACDP